MLLAGDIGGTKTLLGLFTPKPDRPSAIDVGEFVTLDYQGLEPMIEAFLESRDVEPRHIEAACFGVAGAVTDQIARMTNVPWLVDATAIQSFLGRKRKPHQIDAVTHAKPKMWAMHDTAVAIDDVCPVVKRVACMEGEEVVLDRNCWIARRGDR